MRGAWHRPEALDPRAFADTAFLGVDMRTHPAALPPGMVSKAINCRFERGEIQPRKGMVKVPHRYGEWFPLVFPADFDQILAYDEVLGVAVFDDPNDLEWLIVVARTGASATCYAVRQHNVARLVPLPGGVTIDGPVMMVQGVSKLVMARGPGKSYLVLEDVDIGWTEGEFTDGTSELPGSDFVLFIQNRVLAIVNRDEVAWSDVLDLTRYSIVNQGRINKGSSDKLVGVYAFNDFTVVAAKERSLYAITNLVPNSAGEFNDARLDTITTDFGIVAPKSVIHTGNDLIGLSRRGLISIRQTETNALQGVDLPLSDRMQPMIDRINWLHAHKAVAAKWRNRAYFAVPIDAAEVVQDELLNSYTYDSSGDLTLNAMLQYRRYRLTFGANDTAAVIRKLTAASVTRSGSTATFTSVHAHGLATGDQITVEGADQAEYNGTFSVTRVSDTVFTYTVSGSPASPATGTVLAYRPAWRLLKSANRTHDFTAISEYLYLEGSSNQPVTASLKPVFAGVNNAILVYNFLTQQWEGYDEGPGIMVQEFVLRTFNGEERLSFIGSDGFESLYEEGLDDEVLVNVFRPWVEVRVSQSPRPGYSIQVNNGSIVTAAVGDANTASTWASRNLHEAISRFQSGWVDGTWSADGVTVSEVTKGVRFTSTTSQRPAVALLGDWYERVVSAGHSLVRVPIRQEVLTRGYSGWANVRFLRCQANLSTYHPCYTVRAIGDGQEEKTTLASNRVKDRRRYMVFGKGNYDTSNASSDHGDPYREDYSVSMFGLDDERVVAESGDERSVEDESIRHVGV